MSERNVKDMAINFAEKYEKQIVKFYTHESYIQGRVNRNYNWDGVRAISVYTPITQELGIYDRTASTSRFGEIQELQNTIQRMELTQEPCFNIAIDRGNYNDTQLWAKAGEMMQTQLAEQNIPQMDKYAFRKWAEHAGLIDTVTATSKTDIVEKMMDGATAMSNKLVPNEKRYVYIPWTNYNQLRLSTEFIGCDPLAVKSLTKGTVGTLANMEVCAVPDVYLPAGVQFMITQKKSVLAPLKIQTHRILDEHPYVDGWVLQGRDYYDAFVLDTLKDGVYVAVTSDGRVADPTAQITTNQCTITATGGATAYYTTDGSDPRNESNPARKAYSASFPVEEGATVKFYQTKEGLLPSNVVEKTNGGA